MWMLVQYLWYLTLTISVSQGSNEPKEPRQQDMKQAVQIWLH